MHVMKILLFESKRLSYDSSWCFMEMFRRGLERLGADVTVCLLENIQRQEKELESFCSMGFEAVFDINSALVAAEMDGNYYLDCLDAPFYHIIVDHPLHVHAALQIPLQNYHVICLDHYHKEYLEKYYPHIKKVYVMPFGGILAEEFNDEYKILPMEKRPYHILFPGTYTPLVYYQQQMDAKGEFYREIAEEILLEYQRGSQKTIDELFMEKSESDGSFFAMKMHKARFIDRYIREWYREQILESLLSRDVVVDVVGFRWEMYHGSGSHNLRIHEPCSYAQQLAMLGQSKMVLNVQPLFLDGIHDRVMNAMMNQSVAVTDGCCWLQENFSETEEFFRYDKNHPEEMASWVKENREENPKLEDLTQKVYRKVKDGHSWYERVKVLMQEIGIVGKI